MHFLVSSATMSFRLVRNLSLFSEGFPTPECFRDCGNDNLCGLTYDFLIIYKTNQCPFLRNLLP
jgi:hypothetical protein